MPDIKKVGSTQPLGNETPSQTPVPKKGKFSDRIVEVLDFVKNKNEDLKMSRLVLNNLKESLAKLKEAERAPKEESASGNEIDPELAEFQEQGDKLGETFRHKMVMNQLDTNTKNRYFNPTVPYNLRNFALKGPDGKGKYKFKDYRGYLAQAYNKTVVRPFLELKLRKIERINKKYAKLADHEIELNNKKKDEIAAEIKDINKELNKNKKDKIDAENKDINKDKT